MAEPITLDPSALLRITFDFSDELPALTTVSSIAFACSGLTLDQQTNDYSNAKATIRASAASHGVRYRLEATAVLSNGETLNQAADVIGWNG